MDGLAFSFEGVASLCVWGVAPGYLVTAALCVYFVSLALHIFSQALSLQEASRREAVKAGAAAFGAAFLPVAANAAVGESPRFSVFGLVGDGTSLSEGAAYGSDQSTKVYSPYSVYGEAGENSLYKPDDPFYAGKKKAVVTESRNRLTKLPKYIDRKEWFNVSDELTRYMYETRGAIRFLAKTPEQKKAATEFFKAIEKTDLAAKQKKQDACAANAKDSLEKLDALTKLI